MISLKDILGLVGDNDWEWRILELDGTGVLPHGMSWDEFDQLLEVGPYVLSWPGLMAFADGLVQVLDGEIAAAVDGIDIARIQAFDSTEWTIRIRATEFGDLDARIARMLANGS